MTLRSLLALLLVAVLPACLDAVNDVAPTTGISVALTAPGPQGTVYVLRNAAFDVRIPGTDQTEVLIPDEADATASMALERGIYEVRLRGGWEMVRVGADGATEPVTAILASANPQEVMVLANTVTPTSFQFLLASEQGTLQIAMGVHTARTLTIDFRVERRQDSAGGDFLASYVGRRLGMSILYDVSSQTAAPGRRDVAIAPAVVRLTGDTEGILSQMVRFTEGHGQSGGYSIQDLGNGNVQVRFDLRFDFAGQTADGNRAFAFAAPDLIQPGQFDENGVPVDPRIDGTAEVAVGLIRGSESTLLIGTARLTGN